MMTLDLGVGGFFRVVVVVPGLGWFLQGGSSGCGPWGEVVVSL